MRRWAQELIQSKLFLVALVAVAASWIYIGTMPPGAKATLYAMALLGLMRMLALTAMAFYGWRVLVKEPRRRTESLGAALIAVCGLNYLLLAARTILTVVQGEVNWWHALFSTQPDLRGGLGATITSLIGAAGVAIFLHAYEEHIPGEDEIEPVPRSSKLDLILPAGTRKCKECD